MIELPETNGYPLLDYLSQKRREAAQPYLDINLLAAQSGSQDQKVARQARQKLQTRWNLAPENDARQARSVDIMEQLEGFSEAEIQRMCSQIVGLQLTEGCNGNCSFCLFSAEKGVSAKYSFESLAIFIRKYASYMNKREPALYWNSDPFDYRDGEHTFLDVYKLYRELRPDKNQFVSTAVPRGGQKDLIEFLRFVMSEQKEYIASKKNPTVEVRLSLAQHNVDRAESLMRMLTNVLLADGHTEAEINAFYSGVLKLTDLSTHFKLGRLINQHDDVLTPYGPACADGVIFTPKAVEAIMMTAATIYEPSGQKNITIQAGSAQKQTPRHVVKTDFSSFERPDAIVLRTNHQQVILPKILDPIGGEYHLADETENLILKMGREVLATSLLIQDLSELVTSSYVEGKTWQEEYQYLDAVNRSLADKLIRIRLLLKMAREHHVLNDLSQESKVKLEYYILLLEVYQKEITLIHKQIQLSRPPEVISAMAMALRQVGKDSVSGLPELLADLSTMGSKSADLSAGGRVMYSRSEEGVIEKIAKRFNVDTSDIVNMPSWFFNLRSAFVGKR